MPVWHAKTQNWVAEGKLVVLGITQEQHPDRCRLFAQWQNFGWPILWDPINTMESAAVPIIVAIDENGVVRSTRPRPETFEEEFLNVSFSENAQDQLLHGPAHSPGVHSNPDLNRLKQLATQNKTARAYRDFADAAILWGGSAYVDEAIEAYSKTVELQSDDANALFRLGVAYRQRHDSASPQADDFQNAVLHWERALALNPNQYIWRRRIQQYGPRLEKPYSFYDWVDQARRDLVARGETPLELSVDPQGAELAHPARQFAAASNESKSPDPEGKILRDTKSLILSEITLVPSQVRPGGSCRIHIALSPNEALKAHWNNESEPLQIWIETPVGWQVSQPSHTIKPFDDQPITNEIRRVDFEVQIPKDATGKIKLPVFALSYVCEDRDGTCLFLRKDLDVDIEVIVVPKRDNP